MKSQRGGETISKQAQRILPNRLAVELHKFRLTSHSLFDCRKSFGFTARQSLVVLHSMDLSAGAGGGSGGGGGGGGGGMAQASRPLAKAIRVKNKQPAQMQITAEQILRESKEQQGADPKVPKTKITDQDELDTYR
jgi:hypothetical protein